MALLCLFSAVALTACGGGDDASVATASAATPAVSAAAPTNAPAPATGSPAPAPAPVVAPTSAIGSLLPAINAALIPAALPAFTTARRASAGGDTPAASDIGAFRTSCTASHMNFDDPLVYPGQVGASHLHVFWGNSDTNANSTAASIASSGGSTCAGGILNRTAYWAPAMVDTATNTPMAPSNILVYYKTGYGGVKPANVKAVPVGLRMIAGSSKATTAATIQNTRYTCGDFPGPTIGIPTCSAGGTLEMEVEFPQCWDGVNLDSPDHQSHMAYPTGSGCPASHPVAIPVVSYEIYYKVGSTGTSKWRLSSDNYDASTPGGYSGHGDYIYGWDVATMATFIQSCDDKSLDCHGYLLGDGTTLY